MNHSIDFWISYVCASSSYASQPRLLRTTARVLCTWACVLVRYFYAAFFHTHMECLRQTVSAPSCGGWVRVEFMRPFDRKLWSQLSFRPLAISRARSFLRLCPFCALLNLSFSRLKGDSTTSRGKDGGNSPHKFVSPRRCLSLGFWCKVGKTAFFMHHRLEVCHHCVRESHSVCFSF